MILNFLNNLLHITKTQGGTIHHFINLNDDKALKFFEYMNIKIINRGFMIKSDIIKEAEKFDIKINNLGD